MLSQIADYAKEEHPDAILICGDIYDKSAPSGEAYVMFDRFLEALSEIRPGSRFSSSRATTIPRAAVLCLLLSGKAQHLSVRVSAVREDEFLKKIELRTNTARWTFICCLS